MFGITLLFSLSTACFGGTLNKNTPALTRNYIEVLTKELDKAELTQLTELKVVKTVMRDRTLESGTHLELRCEVAGIPTPIVNWFHNGHLLEGVYENTITEKLLNVGRPTIQNGVTSSRLHIHCVDKTHGGVYKCIATAGKKTVHISAHISIVGSSVCEATPQPPVIQMWSDVRFENEGNTVQLLCRTQKTGALIVWFNEDRQPLNNLPGYEILPSGDLVISSAQWEHMGQYTCVASNDQGEDQVSVFFYPTAISDPQL